MYEDILTCSRRRRRSEAAANALRWGVREMESGTRRSRRTVSATSISTTANTAAVAEGGKAEDGTDSRRCLTSSSHRRACGPDYGCGRESKSRSRASRRWRVRSASTSFSQRSGVSGCHHRIDQSESAGAYCLPRRVEDRLQRFWTEPVPSSCSARATCCICRRRRRGSCVSTARTFQSRRRRACASSSGSRASRVDRTITAEERPGRRRSNSRRTTSTTGLAHRGVERAGLISYCSAGFGWIQPRSAPDRHDGNGRRGLPLPPVASGRFSWIRILAEVDAS